jgi:hypothetical protein
MLPHHSTPNPRLRELVPGAQDWVITRFLRSMPMLTALLRRREDCASGQERWLPQYIRQLHRHLDNSDNPVDFASGVITFLIREITNVRSACQRSNHFERGTSEM